MLSTDVVVAISVGYVALLFAVAWIGDRLAAWGHRGWLSAPVIYTLSISVYCTSWTFYGAVGSAARNGLEFVTIYLGPTLVFVGWWWVLRKLVRIGRVHRITSIADMISSRYGKSPSLAAMVTLIAVIATTPYIALQLQSVVLSFEAITGSGHQSVTAFWVAGGMALFTILFGTRSIDANERHHGVVAAIALEALVKIAAFIAVGIFATWGVAGGVGDVFARMPPELLDPEEVFGPRWLALIFLAGAAVIVLPRQFQVTVVENADERQLATASWMFPLYLFLMSIFTLPIAVVGLTMLPAGANPDLFVLGLPLAFGREDLALLAFIGGFSAATSMVIVASIALATMVSNHIVVPLAIQFAMRERPTSGDVRNMLLTSRRIAIAAILALGFLYYELSGGTGALASIGLIAFAGIAQVLPSLLGGLFWRGATRVGALAGLVAGFILWAWTLYLPSFGGEVLMPASVIAHGPFGIEMLRPQAMLGLAGTDPLIHALVWSLGVNTSLFLIVSLTTHPDPLERLQGALFVDVFRAPLGNALGGVRSTVTSEDLFILAQRILGVEPARVLFEAEASAQGLARGLPRPTDALIARLERELAGTVGGASAHAMVTRVVGAETVGLSELMQIADETQKLIETTARLADKSAELERTAEELRGVNARLRALDAQKDDFLSQVSHELRTPMTSIRSFSEILLREDGVDRAERERFLSIIHDESLRLTRLLDEILDISRLESGAMDLPMAPLEAERELAMAIATVLPFARESGVTIREHLPIAGVTVEANSDRLRQVLLNLLTNAVKYNDAEEPEIGIDWHADARSLRIDVIDNGGGVSRGEAETIFSKFARGERSTRAQGAGLGLPISQAVMRRMGGDLQLVFREDGSSFFRIRLPLAETRSKRAPAAE